ncbi:MAG: hypothetical protein AAF593_03620 [Planctomycetota bacterium]
MSWYSIYGTGATIHGITPEDDGRVRFTSWLSVLWIPLVPLSTWTAVYAGERPPDGLTDESHCFFDLQRIPHDWYANLSTLLSSLLVAGIAILPCAIMIVVTDARAATTPEMIIIFASVFWACGVIFWSERRRRQKLQAPNQRLQLTGDAC